ncbi:MAG: sirohydrochlorin cobaltochelatase [Spirochaetales bacterium]|nr:sirohydrochlorin cobaltochelatase [Spirochaetales bacterium]
MQKLVTFVTLSGLFMVLMAAGCVSAKSINENPKPLILIAAFGSSYDSGLSNLNDFDKSITQAFPDHEVRWGFTASFIVNKLRKQGVKSLFDRQIPLETLDEALDRTRLEGHYKVLVQSLHLMVGAEFRQVMDADTRGLNVKYSFPLLFNSENIEKVVKALESEIADKQETATLFCAHGNEKHPEYNAQLVEIDQYLRKNYTNTYLAVMEGNPEFETVEKTIKTNGSQSVKFVTFMLTFGDHISNDVMGAEEDSMKSRLGLPAKVSNGLASNSSIQQIFIKQMGHVLKQFN